MDSSSEAVLALGNTNKKKTKSKARNLTARESQREQTKENQGF